MRIHFVDNTLIKFLAVGVCNTIVGCGIMFLLYNIADCSYWISSAANYISGGFLSFFLNKYFTFHSKKWSWKEIIRFIMNLAVCYLFAYGLAKPLVNVALKNLPLRIRENVAMLAGMCIFTVLNYFGQRFFAFHNENEKD